MTKAQGGMRYMPVMQCLIPPAVLALRAASRCAACSFSGDPLIGGAVNISLLKEHFYMFSEPLNHSEAIWSSTI